MSYLALILAAANIAQLFLGRRKSKLLGLVIQGVEAFCQDNNTAMSAEKRIKNKITGLAYEAGGTFKQSLHKQVKKMTKCHG